MKRPAARCSPQGALLVEAIISAVVIAVGLVFISRGLAGQLRALERVEEHQTAQALARGKLLELEATALAGVGIADQLNGYFASPHDDYEWSTELSQRLDLVDEEDEPLALDVTLTVERRDGPAGAVRIGAVWLADWVI